MYGNGPPVRLRETKVFRRGQAARVLGRTEITGQSNIDLTGRRVLVTGAAGGIGLSIAASLVKSGARVVINDVVEDRLAQANLENDFTGAVAGDVSEEGAVKDLLREAADLLGGLDGLVNNAGIAEPIKGTMRQSTDDWRRVIEINLQSVFLMSREAAKRMQEGGSIVNIASVAGMVGLPASNAYGVSKAGVIMMTRTMACDLSRFGIRVNAIAPGFIQAPMANVMTDQVPYDTGAIVRRIPLGRPGTAQEVANTAVFLLSGLASFITGVVLPVDGGWSAFGGVGDAPTRQKA